MGTLPQVKSHPLSAGFETGPFSELVWDRLALLLFATRNSTPFPNQGLRELQKRQGGGGLKRTPGCFQVKQVHEKALTNFCKIAKVLK